MDILRSPRHEMVLAALGYRSVFIELKEGYIEVMRQVSEGGRVASGVSAELIRALTARTSALHVLWAVLTEGLT